MKVKLIYHKKKFKSLMERYSNFLDNLNCGYELAKHMFGQVNQLEEEMDIHITEINKLANKKFKLFKEGYRPSWVIN